MSIPSASRSCASWPSATMHRIESAIRPVLHFDELLFDPRKPLPDDAD